MFVVDNSVTMAWCFADEVTSYTESVLDRLRDTQALVPVIWPLEVANVLLVAERRQRITEAQTAHFLELLRALPITVDDGGVEKGWGPALTLGREFGLSAYDACYLELAMRQGLPLATQDTRQRATAKLVGVPLLS